jgi:hypothetical protein
MITARDGPAMTSTIDNSLRLVRAANFASVASAAGLPTWSPANGFWPK